MRMKRAWIFALIGLAASAVAQQREVLLPETVWRLTFSPTSHSLLVNGLSNAYWVAPKKSPAAIPGGVYSQLFMGSDEGWLAGVARTGEVRTLQIGSLKERTTGLRANFIAFAPGGDRLACFQVSQHPDNVIEVLDMSTGATKRLSRYASDILASSPAGYTVASLFLRDWTRDGIRIDAALEGPDPRAVTYVVDPDLDRASAVGSLGPEPTFADGSILAHSGSSLVKARLGGTTEVLFTEKDSGGPINSAPSMGPGFAAARAKNLVTVFGTDGKHAGVWLVNTMTGKTKRVAYGKWSPDDSGRYVVADISPDGEWLAYRDFENPKKIVVRPIKKL